MNPSESSFPSFGTLPCGREASLIELTNRHGLRARITNLGATLVGMEVPDRDGRMADVTLGYDSAADYLSPANPYLGATVGRFGNRIAHGRFTLDGNLYQLALNNAPGGIPSHLHGGDGGFHRKLWEIVSHGPSEVRMRLVSPDGDDGYPGELEVEVLYALNDDNELIWQATANSRAATVLNLVHHSYWNLSGNPMAPVLDHELSLRASRYLPTDPGLIPTGELRSVADTPLDFTSTHRIGERIDGDFPCLGYGAGYDHAWVLDDGTDESQVAATFHHPESGRTLEILTNQPAIQVYAGNFLGPECFGGDHPAGKSGQIYPRRSGLCLETENFPDAPNHPHFPSAVLRPGETYRHIEIHRFSVR
ncbi:MAG: galactose mutarotase [Akkermansiaceae bacterium]|jgi:aldose 1-epimerase|nr:galactose mutarotase [Akkermansiaceae bacterium]